MAVPKRTPKRTPSKLQGPQNAGNQLDKSGFPPERPSKRVIQSIDPKTGMLRKEPKVIKKGSTK